MRPFVFSLLLACLVVPLPARAFFTIIDAGRWPAGTRQVIMTFDDGPNGGVSAELLDVLARHGVTGTFFYTGRNVEKYPELVSRAHREGHQLALHGYAETWPYFWDVAALRKNLERTSDLLRTASGDAELLPRLYRPPRGVITPAVFWLISRCRYDLGYITFYGRDSAATDEDAADVISRTVDKLLEYQGGAILFHTSRFKADPASDNAIDKRWLPDALDRFIGWAIGAGFSFVTYDADPDPPCHVN